MDPDLRTDWSHVGVNAAIGHDLFEIVEDTTDVKADLVVGKCGYSVTRLYNGSSPIFSLFDNVIPGLPERTNHDEIGLGDWKTVDAARHELFLHEQFKVGNNAHAKDDKYISSTFGTNIHPDESKIGRMWNTSKTKTAITGEKSYLDLRNHYPAEKLSKLSKQRLSKLTKRIQKK